MKKLGYVYTFEYWQTGFTFVLGDVVVKIFHICVLPDKPESEMEDESLQLLDPSGKWMVKAYVNVQQLTDLKGLSNANSQLEKLQNELASLVTLRVPDRLAFDTRITARQR
jgi:mediator of RNA polymerase II transcription subunit 18